MDEKDGDDEDVLSKNSKKHVMPSDYIFPSFFAFILWGPFVPADERLSLFLSDYHNISTGQGRKESQNEADKQKSIDHKNDTTGERGYTIDQ